MPLKNKVRLQSKKNILTKNPAKVKMLHNKKKKQKNSTPRDTGNNSSEKHTVKNPLKKLATSTITKIKKNL